MNTITTANPLAIDSSSVVLVEGVLAPSLLDKYREILISSLITSCGLDTLMFRNDEVNGHVDTLHNVAEIQNSGGDPVFKKSEHKEAYDNRGAYDSAKYHSDKAYIDKGREWNKLRDEGKLIDRYTGEPIKPGQKYDRDHVVAAKTIHNDAQFSLSGLDRVATANSDINLAPTDRSINRSMQDKSASEFQNYQAKKVDEWENELVALKSSIAEGRAPEGAEKKVHTLEQRLAANGERVQQAEDISRKDQARKHASAYYRSKNFLGTTSWEAGKAGLKMGGKQALGLVLMEVSIAVQEELPAMLHEWRQAPDWKSRLDPRPFLERVAAALRAAWGRIRAKTSRLFDTALSGFTSGMMAEIMTTVINIFSGTAKSVMQMLRNFWAGIVESIKILTFNPDNLGAEDKLAAVMRILSVAIGGMIQPVVAEAIDKLMLTHGPLLPGFVREVISQFAGAALGGIVSVSLVYAIDHSPVVKTVIAAAREAGAFTDAVYQQVAYTTGLTWQALKRAPDALAEAVNSPAFNLIAFVASPPLGVALYFNRHHSAMRDGLDRLNQGQQRIDVRLGSLEATIHNGLGTLETLIRENNALLRCVIAGQQQQMAMLAEIRNEMRHGFAQTHELVRQSAIDGADLDALRRLQENLHALFGIYRDCAALMARGQTPLPKDLHRIEGLAQDLIAKFETSFNSQVLGAPARLPLLTGMAFALGAWRDARNTLGDDLALCFERSRHLASLAHAELQVLTKGASFWQLARDDHAWLIGQYVVIRRTLITMPQAQIALEFDAVEGFSPSAPAFDLVGWNDGLDNARDLIAQAQGEDPLETLPIKTYADRESWSKLAGLPLKATTSNVVAMEKFRQHLGIPADFTLGQTALELLRAAPEMIESSQTALESALA